MKRLIYLKNYSKGFLRSHFRLNQKNQSVKHNYLDLGILNPAIGSSNLGDLIIYESVYNYLRGIFKEDIFTNYPIQLHTSFDSKVLMNKKKLLFISGTNLLSSNLETQNQWKIVNTHRKFIKNKVVLVGVGWWQYQGYINKYSAKIYKSVFSNDVIHAVRDSYTEEKLKDIGIKNVLNTSCPTLWGISPAKCKNIPIGKAMNVVTTLTCYNKNKFDDGKMLKILSENYGKVYLWLQGYDDFLYLNEIKSNIKNIEIIPPTLESYDDLLIKGEID